MVVCYVTPRHWMRPERFGSCIVQDHYDSAAAAMNIDRSPSECLWIVPGTIDPMED